MEGYLPVVVSALAVLAYGFWVKDYVGQLTNKLPYVFGGVALVAGSIAVYFEKPMLKALGY